MTILNGENNLLLLLNECVYPEISLSNKAYFYKLSNRKMFNNLGNMNKIVNRRGLNLQNKYLDRSKFKFMNRRAGMRISSVPNTRTK